MATREELVNTYHRLIRDLSGGSANDELTVGSGESASMSAPQKERKRRTQEFQSLPSYALLKNFDQDEFVFIDTRMEHEVAHGRAAVKHYVNIPSHTLGPIGFGYAQVDTDVFCGKVLEAAGGDSARTVVLSCAAGVRSKAAAQWIVEHGWHGQVLEMGDGFNGWQGPITM